MKTDINAILNKLVTYAMDNLLLDTLDQTYMLNRLADTVGVPAPSADYDADYGDATIAELLGELKSAVPSADITAAAELLFPMPRTVNYYLESKLERGLERGLDFVFELYAHGYNAVSHSPAVPGGAYISYSAENVASRSGAALNVGEQLAYTPLCVGNRIATLAKPDVSVDDAVAREYAFVSAYGEAIVMRVGSTADYLCCKTLPVAQAKVKKQLSDGAVKIALLDYPVPALGFTGIAKNAVMREVVRVAKAATGAGYATVIAAAATGGTIAYYLVLAGDIASTEFICSPNALTPCGVFRTKDCTPLLSVLEKGTALSTDLAEFRPIYDKIGGVKHGKNALSALGGALAEMYLPLLTASASATPEQAEALVKTE